MAGRGFGKTRAGAEWVLDRISSHDAGDIHRVALVARTAADARDTMVEGESGLVACAERRGWKAVYEPSKRRVVVTTPNGRRGMCTTYSAEEPDQLRGPQQHTAWADELAAWRAISDAQGNSAWTNLQFGLRLGDDPRVVITTTPRPTPEMRNLVKDGRVVITRGSTYDNLANLAPAFRAAILDRYEGTRVGRQELMAEMLEDVEGALWRLADIDAGRITPRQRPELARIVVAVDPPATATGDECGIVVAGLGVDGIGYVLDDRSMGGLTPDGWGRRAVQAYVDYGCDEIVIETNQGGDMAVQVLTTAARQMVAEGAPTRTVKVERVHASRGKRARAEPVSALYEQGRVRHIGTHMALEDQMTTWTPDTANSPDRLDAMVWAVTHLMLSRTKTVVEW
jgi:phage terminase large subunit-like protein